ncbi:MAG: hypothetical protein ACRDNM_08635 [Gaiellaceae bacterium]
MTRALALLFILSLGLVAGGCGGGGKSPSVASLGSSGTTTTNGATQSAAPSIGAASGSGGGNLIMKMQDGAKFAACMRKNGVPNFPDPSATGVVTINGSSGIDPSSPKFRSAQQTCRKVLPNGGQPSPQQIAKAQQAALKFSACMRSNGLKDFPDPTFRNGGVSMSLRGGPGSDLDPSSPLFEKAQRACLAYAPGKVALPASPGGGK